MTGFPEILLDARGIHATGEREPSDVRGKARSQRRQSRDSDATANTSSL